MAVEKDEILAAIRDTGATVQEGKIVGGNLTNAARKLGVARKTLQNRMRYYGIPRGQSGRRRRKISYSKRSGLAVLGGAAAALGLLVLAGKKRRTV